MSTKVSQKKPLVAPHKVEVTDSPPLRPKAAPSRQMAGVRAVDTFTPSPYQAGGCGSIALKKSGETQYYEVSLKVLVLTVDHDKAARALESKMKCQDLLKPGDGQRILADLQRDYPTTLQIAQQSNTAKAILEKKKPTPVVFNFDVKEQDVTAEWIAFRISNPRDDSGGNSMKRFITGLSSSGTVRKYTLTNAESRKTVVVSGAALTDNKGGIYGSGTILVKDIKAVEHEVGHAFLDNDDANTMTTADDHENVVKGGGGIMSYQNPEAKLTRQNLTQMVKALLSAQ